MTNEYRLPLNSKVRLKGDRTDVYTLAKAGAEGWVRERTMDPVGAFPMVLVEWDKSHWAYNGQPDTWTFEDHFDLVQEQEQVNDKTPDQSEIAAALEVLRKAASANDEPEQRARAHPEPERHLQIVPDEPEPEGESDLLNDEEYLRLLRSAAGHAAGAEAFLVVAVKHEEGPFGGGKTALVPRVFKGEKSDAATTLLGLQLAHLAAIFHQELAVEQINSQDPEPPTAA